MPVTSAPFAGQITLGADLTATHDTAQHRLGTIACDQVGNFYVYVFADTEAIAALDLVNWDETALVLKSDAASDRVDGFAPTAIPVDEYGWVGFRGDFADVPVATGVAVDEYINYLTNSSGQAQEVVAIDEGGSATPSAATHSVRGVVLTSPSSNAAVVRLY